MVYIQNTTHIRLILTLTLTLNLHHQADKKPSEISELERAFAASGHSNSQGMDAKDGNFSVFSGGNNTFSVFGRDFTDETDREAQSNQDMTGGSRLNHRHKSVDGSILNQSGGSKLNISSSISKVIPSLSAISGRSNALPQNATSKPTQPPSVPEYSNAPGNRSSVRNIPKIDPTNAGREKSPIEKQMISQNKRIIRHKFEDRDEKGNVACKFQCYVYFAKQFEALRQCYFDEKDNENFIRSLSMSRRWTAQGDSHPISTCIHIKLMVLCVCMCFRWEIWSYFFEDSGRSHCSESGLSD